MTAPALDLALLLEAVAARDADPVTRFIRSLEPPLRAHAEETVRLRAEFAQHASAMLSERDHAVAIAHATWIAQHAQSVAYRWSALARAVTRWAELDAGAAIIALRPESP